MPEQPCFLAEPPPSAEAQQLYDGDLQGLGYVMNASVLWAHQPSAHDALFDLVQAQVDAAGLTFRQRGVLISSCASTMGDAYCSLAWGTRLAGAAGDDVAGSVLRGSDDGLDATDRALARWARAVAKDPNGTTEADVEALRAVGFDDAQIFAVTAFVALRLAFSVVNDALGARPDQPLHEAAPASVREAVTYGRPAAGS